MVVEDEVEVVEVVVDDEDEVEMVEMVEDDEDEVEVEMVVVDDGDEDEVVVEMIEVVEVVEVVEMIVEVVEVVVIAPVAPVVASENALPLYKRWEQQTHPSIHYLIQILSTSLTFRRLPRACSIF